MTDELVPEFRDDLELPETRVRTVGSPQSGGSKWSWVLDLSPGQSAIIKLPTHDELARIRNILGSTVHRFGKQYNRKFTVRTLERDPRTGEFRCAVKRVDGVKEEEEAGEE